MHKIRRSSATLIYYVTELQTKHKIVIKCLHFLARLLNVNTLLPIVSMNRQLVSKSLQSQK